MEYSRSRDRSRLCGDIRTRTCIACACTCTTQVLPHISILCFAHPHFPIGARCTRESQHALPRLKNKLGYLRAHADVIFCHIYAYDVVHMCMYIRIACACMRTDTTLPHISNFASHVHVFRSVHVAIARGSHSMRCHVASPQEQTRAHADVKNNVMHMQYIARMRTGTTLPHISAFRFACPHLDVHVARASQHAL